MFASSGNSSRVRLLRRVGLVAGLGLLAACGPKNATEFEEQARDLVCAYNAECPGEMSGVPLYPYPTDDSCAADFESTRMVCSTDACDFNKSAANKCIKRLEKAYAQYDADINHKPCRRVYDCDSSVVSDGFDPNPCDINRPGCFCTSGDAPLSPLGVLGFFVLWRMRRRRA